MSIIERVNSNKKLTPIRVAVVGVGMMGQNHLRIYSMLSGIEVVGVVDSDETRAKEAALRYGCAAFTHVEELIGKVDAVTIAVPSSLHADIGEFFLNHGIHCLIEKPMAITEAECHRLINAAEKNGAILLVGHIEHFNPAVQQLSRILAEGHRIHAIDVHRMSGNSRRITDIDVVMDLMIHDLEIVISLINQPVLDLAAQAVCEARANGIDYVSALLLFSGGAIANLTASRITQTKVRRLSITSDIGYITLDYSAQELLICRQTEESTLVNSEGFVFDQAIERVLVRPTEPLIAEIQNFIASIRAGMPLGVDGKQALAALKLVWQIQDQINLRRTEGTRQVKKLEKIE